MTKVSNVYYIHTISSETYKTHIYTHTKRNERDLRLLLTMTPAKTGPPVSKSVCGVT